jgi:hypothetical protein
LEGLGIFAPVSYAEIFALSTCETDVSPAGSKSCFALTSGCTMEQSKLKEQEVFAYQLQHTKENLKSLKSLTGEAIVTPEKSFHVERPAYTENMDLDSLIKACEEVCASLKSNTETDVLTVSTVKPSQGGGHSKSTVCL